MRALEKRPEDRYQSAEEMRHDLEEFLDESGLRSGNRRMALYMQELFAPDAPTSDAGVAASRAFAEPRPPASGAAVARSTTNSEELDLDRRAPLAMRIEVAPRAGRARGARQLGRIADRRGVRAPPRRRRGSGSPLGSAGGALNRSRVAAGDARIATRRTHQRARSAGWSSSRSLHRDRRRGDGNHDTEMIRSSARCERRSPRPPNRNEIRLRSLSDQVLNRGRTGSREGPQGQV